MGFGFEMWNSDHSLYCSNVFRLTKIKGNQKHDHIFLFPGSKTKKFVGMLRRWLVDL